MAKKNFNNQFAGLMSGDYGKEEQQPQPKEKKTNKPKNDMLEGLQETKQEYQAVRVKQEIYNQFAAIAQEKNISFPGRVINRALEYWLEEYQEQNQK